MPNCCVVKENYPAIRRCFFLLSTEVEEARKCVKKSNAKSNLMDDSTKFSFTQMNKTLTAKLGNICLFSFCSIASI